MTLPLKSGILVVRDESKPPGRRTSGRAITWEDIMEVILGLTKKQARDLFERMWEENSFHYSHQPYHDNGLQIEGQYIKAPFAECGWGPLPECPESTPSNFGWTRSSGNTLTVVNVDGQWFACYYGRRHGLIFINELEGHEALPVIEMNSKSSEPWHKAGVVPDK